jgi:flagellar protein FliO/FliZ
MNADPENMLRFVAALAFVVALIAAIAWLARRWMPGGAAIAAGKRRRLQIVETLALDPKTRAMLVRRDDVEHLLVVGPSGAVVVERVGPARVLPETA